MSGYIEMTGVSVVERHRDGFTGRSWGARCPGCNEWLTKYDHTAEEAAELGTIALEDHAEDCPNRIELGQMGLAL